MPSLVASEIMKKEETQSLPQVPCLGQELPTDGLGHVKQSIQNKIRNLEKRKSKLEATKDKLLSGKELTQDQKEASARLNEVVLAIEMHNEFLKVVAQAQTDTSKQQKLQKKKEEKERQQATMNLLRDLLKYQDILSMLGNDDIRPDFLKGLKGAVKIADEDMRFYDEQYKKLCPSREDSSDWNKSLTECAQSAYQLILGTSKPVPGFDNTTFNQFKARLDEIYNCKYFERKDQTNTEEERDVPSKESAECDERPPTPVDQDEPATPYEHRESAKMTGESERPVLVNGSGSATAPPSSFSDRDAPSMMPNATGVSFLVDEQPVSLIVSGFVMSPNINFGHSPAQDIVSPYAFVSPEQIQSGPQLQQSFTYTQSNFTENITTTSVAEALPQRPGLEPKMQTHDDHFEVSDQTTSAHNKVNENTAEGEPASQKDAPYHNNEGEEKHCMEYNNSYGANRRPDDEFVTQGRRGGGYRGTGENGYQGRGGRGGGFRGAPRGFDGDYRGSGGRRGFRGSGGGSRGAHFNGGDHRDAPRDDGYQQRGGGGNEQWYGGANRGGEGRGGGFRGGRGGSRGSVEFRGGRGVGGGFRGTNAGGSRERFPAAQNY